MKHTILQSKEGNKTLESNDLKIFQMVAYEKSISKAALKMSYVQSNVTARIKMLEEELGATLLIRHNKGVTLTNSGEKLLVYAEQIIGLLNKAEADFKSNNSLKIGATETIAASSVPTWLSKYSREYPNVIVTLKTDTQRNLVKQIINGELDGAFINIQCLHDDISSVFSFTEELAIISSIDTKTIDGLLEKPIIINSNIDCPYRTLLEKWIIENKGTSSKFIELDSLEAIKKCVADDMGISLLPKSLIAGSDRLYTHELVKGYDKLDIYFIIKDLGTNDIINNFINIFSEDN